MNGRYIARIVNDIYVSVCVVAAMIGSLFLLYTAMRQDLLYKRSFLVRVLNVSCLR